MVTDQQDQLKICDIPTSVIGYDKKFCVRHLEFYRVYYTRRNNDEVNRVLEVTRVSHCPVCKAIGINDPDIQVKKRTFKIVPAAGTNSD